MPKLIIPVTLVDDVNPGDIQAVSAVVNTVLLLGGYYKIVPMGTNLLWRLGLVNVDASTGSYLADGDQEIIFVPKDITFPFTGTTFSFIRSANTIVDGQINIAVINLQQLPGQEPRNYY